MKVKIKNWTAVGTWQWVSNDDTCGICRMSFEACCPDCRTPGDDCPLVWGECTHCFHIHCIMKWLNSQQQQQQCPMCRQDWKFKEQTHNQLNDNFYYLGLSKLYWLKMRENVQILICKTCKQNISCNLNYNRCIHKHKPQFSNYSFRLVGYV